MDNKRILKDLEEKLFSICMSCSTVCTDDQEPKQSCPRYQASKQRGERND